MGDHYFGDMYRPKTFEVRFRITLDEHEWASTHGWPLNEETFTQWMMTLLLLGGLRRHMYVHYVKDSSDHVE